MAHGEGKELTKDMDQRQGRGGDGRSEGGEETELEKKGGEERSFFKKTSCCVGDTARSSHWEDLQNIFHFLKTVFSPAGYKDATM